jgi:hypothetical protein
MYDKKTRTIELLLVRQSFICPYSLTSLQYVRDMLIMSADMHFVRLVAGSRANDARRSDSNIKDNSKLATIRSLVMSFEHCKYGFAYSTANPNKRPKHQILYNLQESSV